jgi:hypothetical protein
VAVNRVLGLLLNDEGSRHQVAQELRDLEQEVGDEVVCVLRIAQLVAKSFELSDLLSHGPDNLGQTLAPFLQDLEVANVHVVPIARELLFPFPLDQLFV